MSKHLEIFVSVFKKLNAEYVDEVDSGELMRVGIDAMLKSLDPYTVYYSESEIEDYKTSISGEYGGIGSLIRSDSNYVIVTEPYENSPAAKAGLIAGDKIISVDGQSVRGKNAGDLSKLLKGTPGTGIKLVIDRPYVGEINIELTREKN
jgi:carboxyl-terminal processing protease